MSKRKHQSRGVVPPPCRGTIGVGASLLGIQEYRALIAMAAKFILPPRMWSFSGPIPTEVVFGIQVNQFPQFVDFAKPFCELTRDQMESRESMMDCVRAIAGFERGLRTSRPAPRIRKRKLARLRWKALHFLRATGGEKKAGQAATAFLIVVRRHFLAKPKRAGRK